jgi:surfeit locus 1 family protein
LSTPFPVSGRDAASAQPRRLRTLISLLVPAAIAFAVLIALGTWQLQRKAWKEALITTLNERLAEPPEPLPAAASWPTIDRDDTEYRRVAFTATFDDSKEAFVYAAASAFRPDVSGPGYWVFTPARLEEGRVVMVNRGFVPQELAPKDLAPKDLVPKDLVPKDLVPKDLVPKDLPNPARRPGGHLDGPIAITGTLRWPDTPSWFTPRDEPAHNLWFLRDPAAIAAAKGLRDVAPFYVEQETPVPPGGYPQPGRLEVRLRNEHLQYVVTWYGLALVLVVIFAVWAHSFLRSTGPQAKPEMVKPHGQGEPG